MTPDERAAAGIREEIGSQHDSWLDHVQLTAGQEAYERTREAAQLGEVPDAETLLGIADVTKRSVSREEIESTSIDSDVATYAGRRAGSRHGFTDAYVGQGTGDDLSSPRDQATPKELDNTPHRIDQLIHTSELREEGRCLASPPDDRGFYGGHAIYSRDEHDRPVMAEGWTNTEPGAEADAATRAHICRYVRDGLNAAHLWPRSLGGDRAGNLVPLSEDPNQAMSPLERDVVAMTKSGAAVYVQGLAHYDKCDARIPTSIELRFWTRATNAAPQRISSCRIGPDARGWLELH